MYHVKVSNLHLFLKLSETMTYFSFFVLDASGNSCESVSVNLMSPFFDYRNVTVYIRRLTSGERPPEQDPTDPDFDYVTDVSGPKRFKTQNGHFIQNGSSCSDFVRRSNRRQKVRGERELTVSSDMLLRDLKVKVNILSITEH